MADFRGEGESSRPNVLSLGPRPTEPGDAAAVRYETGGDPQDAQRLAAIVEGSEDAIIGKTLEGTVNSWNPGATKIFGYTSAEMIGSSITRIIPDELQAEETEILDKLRRGERTEHYETVRVAKDGHRVPVSLAVSPIRDAAGKVVGASKIARDISSRKAAEQALRDAKALAERSRLEAETANRAKTDFLAAMSHEIRTPLNCIDGLVYLLAKSQGITREQLRYADLVKTACASLRTIVDDILDFSKVEAGESVMDSRPFNLWSLIHDTIALIEPLAKTKNLELTSAVDIGAPEWVSGDQRRLGQVLLNLLSNAVKFTMEGSVKLVARSQTAADGRQQMFFSVTDTGLGVASERLSGLFTPLSQPDNSVSRLQGGASLGLANCKRLVELMGGEIGIVSELGRGSTVSFTANLPRAAEPAQAPAGDAPVDMNAPNETVGVRTCRILVVDDIDTNLEIIETVLREAGHDVVCVNSGLGAIQKLAKSRFDLVLMDVQMPSMDGVTAAGCIRALPAPNGTIPIIAMTAHVLPQQVKTFLEAGMNDHIGKPIDFAKLLDRVRRWQPSADEHSVSAQPDGSDFDRSSFDAFVLAVGADKASRIAHAFLDRLSDAFKSTLSESQREAHSLVSTAGVLGLNGFVAACRRVAEVEASQEHELGAQVLQELQRAQSMARQTLTKHLPPNSH